MSGIQIHTSDPISPAKTKSQALKSYNIDSASGSQGQQRMPPPMYPSARPGQGVGPTPTATTTTRPFDDGPPAPQPGAAPVPPPPATTAKATLPPPPKAGEKPLPPQAYRAAAAPPTTTSAPTTTSTMVPPYPVQIGYQVESFTGAGLPPGSTTSTTTHQSAFTPPTALPSTRDKQPEPTKTTNDTNLQHPPGYMQNQHATEMTIEQRRALEQEQADSRPQGSTPILGYPGSGQGSGGGATATSIWESASALASQVGQKAQQLHVDVWDRIDGKK